MDRNQAARDRLAAAWAAKAKAKAKAKADAKAKAVGLSPGVVPGQVEWEETEIEKTKRLLARRFATIIYVDLTRSDVAVDHRLHLPCRLVLPRHTPQGGEHNPLNAAS